MSKKELIKMDNMNSKIAFRPGLTKPFQVGEEIEDIL